MKVKCIRASLHTPAPFNIVRDQIYEAKPAKGKSFYIVNGREWNVNRFELVEEDGSYEPVPVTLKSPTRTTDNEVDSQELMDFFSRPPLGECKCRVPKDKCPYHKDT